MESIQRDHGEIARLHKLEQDVRWRKIEMAADKQDRLRQYLRCRSITEPCALVFFQSMATGGSFNDWLQWRPQAFRLTSVLNRVGRHAGVDAGNCHRPRRRHQRDNCRIDGPRHHYD